MSEWPKRYVCCRDGGLYSDSDGELVKLEDFDSLLNHAALTIYYSGNHQANSVEEVKQNLLQFLKETENERMA